MTRKISGTYEWAVATINCTIGCPNDCKYCYSKRLAVMQKRITSYSEWPGKNQVCRNITKEKQKYKGTVMFPSTHDVHENNLDVCIDVIANLLEAGNKVLITSKPRIDCIIELCETFKEYKNKNRILFRFTIGTSNNKILRLWEPGAPRFQERFACLTYALAKEFQTSVSMEPMLDSETVVKDARLMMPFVTDGVWIGKMNKIEDRVIGISSREKDRIGSGQTLQEIQRIYNALKSEPKIRWKESFKKELGLELPDKAGIDR